MSYSLGSSTGSFAKGTCSLSLPDRPCVRTERGGRRTVCLASPPRKYKPRGLQATLEHALPPREFALLSSADVPAGPAVPDGARRSRASMATAATTGAVRSSVQLSAANAVLCIDFSSVVTKPQHMVCGLLWLSAACLAARLRALLAPAGQRPVERVLAQRGEQSRAHQKRHQLCGLYPGAPALPARLPTPACATIVLHALSRPKVHVRLTHVRTWQGDILAQRLAGESFHFTRCGGLCTCIASPEALRAGRVAAAASGRFFVADTCAALQVLAAGHVRAADRWSRGALVVRARSSML